MIRGPNCWKFKINNNVIENAAFEPLCNLYIDTNLEANAPLLGNPVLIIGNTINCAVPTGMTKLNGTTWVENYPVHSLYSNISIIGNRFENCVRGVYALAGQSAGAELAIQNMDIIGNTFTCSLVHEPSAVIVVAGANLKRTSRSVIADNTIYSEWPSAYSANNTYVTLAQVDDSLVQNNRIIVSDYDNSGAGNGVGYWTEDCTGITFNNNYVSGPDYAYYQPASPASTGTKWLATNEWETISGFTASGTIPAGLTAYAPAALTSVPPAADTVANLPAKPMIGQVGLANNVDNSLLPGAVAATGGTPTTRRVEFDGTNWRIT